MGEKLAPQVAVLLRLSRKGAAPTARRATSTGSRASSRSIRCATFPLWSRSRCRKTRCSPTGVASRCSSSSARSARLSALPCFFRALVARSRSLERSEATLRESEARCRDFALTSSDWFWETDEQHRFTYLSDHIRAFGQDPETRIGRTRIDFGRRYPQRSGQVAGASVPCWTGTSRSATSSIRARATSRNASSRSAATRSLTRRGGFSAIAGTARDITEKVLAGTRLARGEGDGGGGQPRQISVPRQYEPRAAHAAQCDPRLLGGAGERDRRAASVATDRICRSHSAERRASSARHQRDPRPGAHRRRESWSSTKRLSIRAGWSTAASRSSRIVQLPACFACRSRSNEDVPPSDGRSDADDRDSAQPAVQRHQVHRARRFDHHRGAARPKTAASGSSCGIPGPV